MEFTAEEKKKLNKFLDDYEYLLEEGDYVTFLKKYRDQNRLDASYNAFVDLIKEIFHLNVEWFIENDPDFYWPNYLDAFPDCSVTISENSQLTTIGDYAFYNCLPLTSINIPDSVTTIEEGAFRGCSKLTTVTFSENSQLITIGEAAFQYCSSLTSIYIPDSITTIGPSAFSYCFNLKTITIGENSQLTEIGYNAFSYCSSLASIYIPDSVTSIGSLAFLGCDNLTIYCEASSQPSGWSSSWNPSDCPVVWGYKKK